MHPSLIMSSHDRGPPRRRLPCVLTGAGDVCVVLYGPPAMPLGCFHQADSDTAAAGSVSACQLHLACVQGFCQGAGGRCQGAGGCFAS